MHWHGASGSPVRWRRGPSPDAGRARSERLDTHVPSTASSVSPTSHVCSVALRTVAKWPPSCVASVSACAQGMGAERTSVRSQGWRARRGRLGPTRRRRLLRSPGEHGSGASAGPRRSECRRDAFARSSPRDPRRGKCAGGKLREKGKKESQALTSVAGQPRHVCDCGPRAHRLRAIECSDQLNSAGICGATRLLHVVVTRTSWGGGPAPVVSKSRR